MEQHYGEPVRPVSHYCERLASYADGLNQAIEDHQPEYGCVCGPFASVEAAATVRDGLRLLNQWRFKSHLLWRLIYADESLRTQKCPVHKGHWSGCYWPGDECEHGCATYGNTSGWIALTPERSGAGRAGPIPVVARLRADLGGTDGGSGA